MWRASVASVAPEGLGVLFRRVRREVPSLRRLGGVLHGHDLLAHRWRSHASHVDRHLGEECTYTCVCVYTCAYAGVGVIEGLASCRSQLRGALSHRRWLTFRGVRLLPRLRLRCRFAPPRLPCCPSFARPFLRRSPVFRANHLIPREGRGFWRLLFGRRRAFN